jgi:hypothetical protein
MVIHLQMQTSSIRLQWVTRRGGGGQSERHFLDFVIDGILLQERLKTTYITELGWLSSQSAEKAVGRLLRKEPPDLPDGRQSLYVCPECADLGCGTVSIVIERIFDEIVWKDFGFQNSYMPEVDYEDYDGIGPFAFNATEYYETMSSALKLINEQ